MARYLVVANLTLVGEHLLDALRERARRGRTEIYVVVPAAPDPASWRSRAHEEDLRQARQRLETALERFRALGSQVEVDGEVGDARPPEAIGDVLREHPPFDELILSTLPPGPSRWLGMDLPRRIERAFDVPMTHVVAQPEQVS
ncbi:MAG: hypothetical protein GEU81_13025 [Nitriliruptorales bacterium]|nr:hypothetical protein [Nitriliruptorales bacterium]